MDEARIEGELHIVSEYANAVEVHRVTSGLANILYLLNDYVLYFCSPIIFKADNLRRWALNVPFPLVKMLDGYIYSGSPNISYQHQDS